MKVSNSVNIDQGGSKTHKLFKEKGFEMSVLSSDSEKVETITFPIDISIIRGKFIDVSGMSGDCINMTVAPNTIIGVITANSNSGENVLNVSPTVIDNLKVGYSVSITYDNVNIEDLGICTEIDVNNSTITVEKNLSNSYNAGSYIQMSVVMVEDIYLTGANLQRFVEGSFKSTFLPKETPIKVSYKNNNASEKKFHFEIEYFY